MPKPTTWVLSGEEKEYFWGYSPSIKGGVFVCDLETAKVFKDNTKLDTLDDVSLESLKAVGAVGDSDYSYTAKTPTTLGVWFHLTNQCNLRCKYCYVHKNATSMSEEVAVQSIQKIFTSAKEHGFKKIIFKFSGGEALMSFPLIQELTPLINTQAKQAEIEVERVILTNAILMTDNIAIWLKANDYRLAISLDGWGKYHDSNRVFADGSGCFKQVLRGLKIVQKHQLHFNVTVTIAKDNVSHLPTLTKKLIENKIPFVWNFYREFGTCPVIPYAESKALIAALTKSLTYMETHPSPNPLSSILDRVNMKSSHQFTCGAGRNYLIVSHTGSIHSCQMTLDQPIGNMIKDDPIKTMQQKGTDFAVSVEDKQPCNQCKWKYICSGGCPLQTKLVTGSAKLKSPYCEVYQAILPKLIQTEARRLYLMSQS